MGGFEGRNDVIIITKMKGNNVTNQYIILKIGK